MLAERFGLDSASAGGSAELAVGRVLAERV